MEPALKQRLIGAAVLVALAVIFLPMLIKGPAPESGVSDVPMQMPAAPQGEYETRELPLVAPSPASGNGVVGLDAGEPGNDMRDDGTLPTVDTTAAGAGAMMPPPTPGGEYAVSFGSYASAADAQRVVGALRSSQLSGYQETTAGAGGRTLYRVRIGPYDSRATAEAARLRAAHVRDDVAARVVTLGVASDDSPTGGTGSTVGSTSASQPLAVTTPSAARAEALPNSAAPDASDAPDQAPTKPATATTRPPAAPVAASPAPAPAPPRPATAAADVGFAVQLGAFSNAAEAGKLRDRARAAGFDAFVETVRTDGGSLTRVLAGPVAARADAERMKAQLDPKLGVNGLVRSHP